MGLPFRSIRAGATALLVAAAIGSGGMGGMTSALAADPPLVPLSGTLVNEHGASLGGVDLVISELLADGPIAGYQATTATDGTFSVSVFGWGTAAAPATLSIKTAPDAEITVIGTTCSQTWGVAAKMDHDVALADAPPDPFTVTATTTLVGEVCGTTGTPAGNGNNGGNAPGTAASGAGAGLTPPPTDSLMTRMATSPDRTGPALTLGFIVGLLVAGVLLRPQTGARRR